MEDVRPDRTFLRDLKNLDRRLGVKFNGSHFIITYDRGYGEPANIFRVTGDDGGFRQPDQRDLMVIKRGDLASGDSMEVRLQKQAYAYELTTRESKRKAAEEIRAMTLDNKIQLRNAIQKKYNLGKTGSAFRKIPHKSKGIAL
jgi:hypothetical protein